MKNEIQILFSYPSESEDDIVNGMYYDAKRDGDSKPEFILKRSQDLLIGWIHNSIRIGEQKRGVYKKPVVVEKKTIADQGFGDTLARWIDYLIIKPLERFLSYVKSGACGCNKRRQWLNKVFSYNKQFKQ